MPTLTVVQHVAFEDLGAYEPVLLDYGYEIQVLQAGVDDLAPIKTADLAIVLGGPIGVGDVDRYPWLAQELATVSDRVNSGRPTLGICLGAQLMASALGARVAPTGTKEIGYAPLELTIDGRNSILAPFANQPVLHWHGDHFEIPMGAKLLASTPICTEQAFALGPNLLGFQFHIEVRPDHIERWLIGHTQELGDAGIDPRTIRHDAARLGSLVAERGVTVLESWLKGLDD
ncbi:glutamine amidotransferase [Propionibacterium sp.]|uniref:glutamine amidotransferase n=1 Tax=Propionibacterium sp. TaxID=1977903 RepID=UPI0039E7C102